MNYATIKTHDTANGPGVRVSLFVSGCTHQCKGCFNPEAWDFNYGAPFYRNRRRYNRQRIGALVYPRAFAFGRRAFLNRLINRHFCRCCVRYVRLILKKTIWCYTGYDFEQDLLTGRLCDWPVTEEMLSYIDVLVDGEFKLDLKNPNLRFRGSSNQRVIDLKNRCMVMNWFYGQKLIKIKTPSTYNNMGGVFV